MKVSFLAAFLVTVFTIGAVLAGQEEAADSVAAQSESDAAAKKLDMEVREILGRSCAISGCHGGRSPRMQLSLESEHVPGSLIDVPSRQNTSLKLVDAEDPARSYLLIKVTGGEGIKGKRMPLLKRPLRDEEIAAIMTWVRRFAAGGHGDHR